MRTIERTTRFKKDFKKIIKQNFYDEDIFLDVITKLANDIPLEERFCDHALHGDFEGARECHIKPDWLLIYAKPNNELRLIMIRTGTHSELF